MHGCAANREQLTIDSLDGHAFLVRLKIAALLAIIDRRLNVTGEDWALAEIVMRTSDAVRRRTLDSVSAKAAKVEQASRDRHVRKEVGADRAKHLDRVERGARHLVSLVEKAGGEMLVTAARRSMRRYRDDLEEIVEYAVERGWLVEHSAPSHTDQPKRILKTVPLLTLGQGVDRWTVHSLPFVLRNSRTLSELVFLSFPISPVRRNRRETQGVDCPPVHTSLKEEHARY